MVWKLEVTWSTRVEAEAVLPALGRLVEDHPREQRPVAVALDEAEGGVAERRGDGEPSSASRRASSRDALDVLDDGAAAPLQELERLLHVLHREVEGADAVRVLAQPARRAPALAAGLAHHQDDVARLEDEALLLAAPARARDRSAQLREVHPLRVEAAAALQVVHVPVHDSTPLMSERFDLVPWVSSLILARRVLGVRLAIRMGRLEGGQGLARRLDAGEGGVGGEVDLEST